MIFLLLFKWDNYYSSIFKFTDSLVIYSATKSIHGIFFISDIVLQFYNFYLVLFYVILFLSVELLSSHSLSVSILIQSIAVNLESLTCKLWIVLRFRGLLSFSLENWSHFPGGLFCLFVVYCVIFNCMLDTLSLVVFSVVCKTFGPAKVLQRICFSKQSTHLGLECKSVSPSLGSGSTIGFSVHSLRHIALGLPRACTGPA